MEPYKIYMLSTNPKKDRMMRITGGVIGIIGLSAFYLLRSDYYTLTVSIMSLIYAIGYKSFIKRNFISIDDSGIKAAFQKLDENQPIFFARLYKVYINWEDIESMSKDPWKISITLNNGDKKEIYIGGLMYKDHQELKEKLQEYIEAKGITTTI